MLQAEPQFMEKRKYPRFTINANLLFAGRDNSKYTGFCTNLSHSGIFFITEQFLSKGDSVVITLATNNKRFAPLKARVEIVRTTQSEGKYAVAGKIVEYQ
ncbi:MAG: PilZ domain-containing protein [Nitrospiraceae bacterium]|nr:MAG: PilZ domain-containing protein [Nitrospiraceae bacterium]